MVRRGEQRFVPEADISIHPIINAKKYRHDGQPLRRYNSDS